MNSARSYMYYVLSSQNLMTDDCVCTIMYLKNDYTINKKLFSNNKMALRLHFASKQITIKCQVTLTRESSILSNVTSILLCICVNSEQSMKDMGKVVIGGFMFLSICHGTAARRRVRSFGRSGEPRPCDDDESWLLIYSELLPPPPTDRPDKSATRSRS